MAIIKFNLYKYPISYNLMNYDLNHPSLQSYSFSIE